MTIIIKDWCLIYAAMISEPIDNDLLYFVPKIGVFCTDHYTFY